MSKLIYLASPYSDPDPTVREERFRQVCAAAAHFMQQGHFIFSPIAHTHPIALCGLPGDWKFWGEFARTILERCNELWVLKLPGWSTSVGLSKELLITREEQMPVRFVDWPLEVQQSGCSGCRKNAERSSDDAAE